MTPPFDVVGLGENSVDLTYRLPGPPAPGAKLAASAHRVSCGGQVATTLATCAAFGLRTAYVGAFGTDPHGGLVRDALARRHVDTTSALTADCPNRHAVVLVDEHTGDRTVVWTRDPRLRLRPEDVPADLLRGTRLLHVDDVDPEAAIAAAQIARGAGIPVTCDVDHVSDQTRALLALSTVPILAESVPGALTGATDTEQALRQLRRDHAGWLCVTLGSRGAMLLESDRLHYAPAPQIVAVDTTGAGDVFRGAFICALLRGDGPTEVLRFAVAAAAVSCTREGALDGVPTQEEVTRLLGRASSP